MFTKPKRSSSEVVSPADDTSTDSNEPVPTVTRRTVLQGAGTLAIAATVPHFHTKSRPAASSLPMMFAVQSESLADAFGVNIHLNFLNSIYGDTPAIVNKLLSLGVRHVRSHLSYNLPTVRTGYKALAAGGCQVNAVCQLFNLASQPTNAQLMDEVINSYGGEAAGVFSSFEGVNEPNKYGVPWVAETRARTTDLWNQAKSRPQTAGIPIIGPALGENVALQQDFIDLGDLTSVTDLGSIHLYPRATSPSVLIDQYKVWAQPVYGNHDIVCTEGGYSNALNQTQPSQRPLPQNVAGRYGPRHLLEHFIRGNKFFRYELMDSINPAKDVMDMNYGLVAATSLSPTGWTNKQAFRAMQNMLALVGDRGPGFAAAGLPMSITGGDASLRQLLLQKRDGSHLLCLWRDVALYDTVSKAAIRIAAHNVTVTLATPAAATVYRPAFASTAFSTFAPSNSFTVALAGDVYIIKLN